MLVCHHEWEDNICQGKQRAMGAAAPGVRPTLPTDNCYFVGTWLYLDGVTTPRKVTITCFITTCRRYWQNDVQLIELNQEIIFGFY